MKLERRGLRGRGICRQPDIRRHGPACGPARHCVDPELIMYDEPFAGSGPDLAGHHGPAHPPAQRRRGSDQRAGVRTTTATFHLADHVIILGPGGCGAGHPDEVMASTDPLVHQFRMLPTGPVPFHYPGPDAAQGLWPYRRAAMNWFHPANLGFAVRSKTGRHWPAPRLFAPVVADATGGRRLRDQGWCAIRCTSWVTTLAIIAVSGSLSVCAGPAGYYTLQRYGSSALGLWWRCRCCASWGRWSRLCCLPACRALSLTAEIGLMRAGEQPSAME